MFFFCFVLFCFFHFVNMAWTHVGVKVSNDISSESNHQITPQTSCILLGKASTKIIWYKCFKFSLEDYIADRRRKRMNISALHICLPCAWFAFDPTTSREFEGLLRLKPKLSNYGTHAIYS